MNTEQMSICSLATSLDGAPVQRANDAASSAVQNLGDRERMVESRESENSGAEETYCQPHSGATLGYLRASAKGNSTET